MAFSARLVLLALIALLPVPARAQTPGASADGASNGTLAANATVIPRETTSGYVTGRGWHVDFAPAAAPAAPVANPLALPTTTAVSLTQDPPAQRPRPVAFEYSDGYRTRRKIHVYASIAMLPLFVTQYAIGDSLYTESTDGKRTAHAVIGSSIGVLFGLNTVTGVWNMWEARKDPAGRTRRLTHAIMMLGADAGFVATSMLAPGDDGGGNRSAHRAVALTSMGVATASYLIMLFTR
jgi:hypothetical protein